MGCIGLVTGNSDSKKSQMITNVFGD